MWRDSVEVVTMDGFTEFKTATAEELPDAVAVMDPVHVLRLAGDAIDRCRRRVQLAIRGHRRMKNDPLYAVRRTLHTSAGLLTDKQKDRLAALFADDAHVEVEATWGSYQRLIAAYRHELRPQGRDQMAMFIFAISTGVPPDRKHSGPRRISRDIPQGPMHGSRIVQDGRWNPERHPTDSPQWTPGVAVTVILTCCLLLPKPISL